MKTETINGKRIHEVANEERASIDGDKVRCPQCRATLGRLPRSGRALVECMTCKVFVIWPRSGVDIMRTNARKLGPDILGRYWV